MGETRVDLLHLLEDLRDAYPGSLEETIASEIVANSLDSRASTVVFTADPGGRTLCVVDDGSGMTRSELRRYHDLAASGKTRGKGIGFAGVGIKLGLLACEEVLTETRCGKAHVATTWRLASRHRAPWSWLPPPGLNRVPRARRAAAPRGASGVGGEHAGKGDQAGLGLGGPFPRPPRARGRLGRNPRPRRVADLEQGRLPAHGPARGAVPRTPQGRAGGGRCAARGVGRSARRPERAPPADRPNRAGAPDGARGPGRGVPAPHSTGGLAPGRPAPTPACR